MFLIKQKRLPITAAWRNGGFNGKLNGSDSKKHLYLLDNEAILSPPLRKAANRWQQV